MSQEQAQYHPVIEELVVTEGQDAGRIKDIEFAQEAAAPMNAARNVHSRNEDDGLSRTVTHERWKQDDHDFISHKIAQTAFKQPWNNQNYNELMTGVIVGRQLAEIEHAKKSK